ncbi:MAG: hypothetical protein ACK5M3_16085 [Dysgonomonas sp.]
MRTGKSFRPLRKQSFGAVKSLIVIFYFILASSLLIILSNHVLLALMNLVVACSFAAYIHSQFVKYLSNFTVYANLKVYLRMTVVGFALLALGLVFVCLGAGFNTAGIALSIAGGVMWLGSMFYVVDNLRGNVDDYVGGFSGASLCMEGLSTYWFLILFFPLFIYNVFIYAEEYAQEYGVAE